MAATTGLPNVAIAPEQASTATSYSELLRLSSRMVSNSPISAPTEKSFPSPFSTTPRTSRSTAKPEKITDNSRHIASVTALPTSALVVWALLRSPLAARLVANPSADRWHEKPTPLLGGIVLEGELLSTVAVVHEFVQVESDGWAWMLEQLREPSPSQEALSEVRKLGERLGELHAVLASDPDDPAFAPEAIGSEDLQRWASSITGELGTTINAATRKLPDLALRRDALVERIQRLAVAPPSGMKIRIHGDLHLGQTLRTGGEWLIFDFEGEPSRPFVMRREKYMPLRDVAGMLRSFAYACATVELEGAPEGERLAPVRRAFLEGYRGRVPSELLSSDEESFTVMLETMELEKLLYELRYEVNHRPDWVKIPARVLMEMCAEPESSGSSQPPEPPTAPA